MGNGKIGKGFCGFLKTIERKMVKNGIKVKGKAFGGNSHAQETRG